VAALAAGRPDGPDRGPWLLFPLRLAGAWLGWGWSHSGAWWSPGSGPADRQRRFSVRVAVLSWLLGENLWVLNHRWRPAALLERLSGVLNLGVGPDLQQVRSWRWLLVAGSRT